MSHEHDIDIDRHVRTYMVVFVSLMGLTLLTVAVSYLHLPVMPAIFVALLIAAVKGSLVACYFMHLISERKLIFIVLLFTVFFFLGCLLVPTFTHLDAVTVP